MAPASSAVFSGLLVALTPAPASFDLPSRRFVAALGATAAIAAHTPTANAIANPWDKGELDLKPEKIKKKMRPDGFGGYVEREEAVQAPILKVINSNKDNPEQLGREPSVLEISSKAAPPPPKRQASKSVSTDSSAPPPSLEEMVANSIRSKEESLGMELSDAEKASIRAKVEQMVK